MKKILSTIVCLFVCIEMLAGCSSNGIEQETDSNENNELSSEPVTMRVGTWNIDSKAHPDIKEMSNIIHDLGIEIVGYQELDVNNTRNDYDMSADFVNDNFPYVHFAKGRDFADGYFGVGTTSSTPFKEISSIPIESTGSRATKTLERIVIEKEEKEIAFYVTHTSWENNDLRRRQFAEIYERLENDPVEYKILVADFNADQSLYEYDLFKDNYNIANGKDGIWFDTFTGEDDSMKVMTVDNIIVSKNIEITNVGSYHSDMADHDLLYADIILNDQDYTYVEHDRALGQSVMSNGSEEDETLKNIVDCDDSTVWTAPEGKQEVIVNLDRVYKGKSIEFIWGENAPEEYKVFTSVDGKKYSDAVEVKDDQVTINDDIKYIKIEFNSENSQLATIKIFADWIIPSAKNNVNILTDEWTLGIDETKEGNALYELNVDNDTFVLSKNGADEGDGYLYQTVEALPNERYQFSFEHMTDTLHSGNFRYEIEQLDEDGNRISTHYAILTDNLNMSEDFREFDYNIITASNCTKIKVALHVLSGEGNLYLKNIALKEIIPTENVFVNTEKKVLKVGDTTKLTTTIYPSTANDIAFEYISCNEDVLTVDSDGVIKAVGKGTALVGVVSKSDLIAESYISITVE